MRPASGITTLLATGAVGLLTLAMVPGAATASGESTVEAEEPTASVASSNEWLGELGTLIPGLRLLDSAEPALSASGNAKTEDTVTEVAPEPQPLVQPDWQHPTGDLPKGRAVPIKHFWISAPFGNRGPHTGGIHSGLDFAADWGTPIYSITDGKVVNAEWIGAAGKAVVVRTDKGELLLYGHLSKFHVKKGQRIKAGKEIGHVGTTGNSTGPHLHFQVRTSKRGKLIDPQKWLGVSEAKLDEFGNDPW